MTYAGFLSLQGAGPWAYISITALRAIKSLWKIHLPLLYLVHTFFIAWEDHTDVYSCCAILYVMKQWSMQVTERERERIWEQAKCMAHFFMFILAAYCFISPLKLLCKLEGFQYSLVHYQYIENVHFTHMLDMRQQHYSCSRITYKLNATAVWWVSLMFTHVEV